MISNSSIIQTFSNKQKRAAEVDSFNKHFISHVKRMNLKLTETKSLNSLQLLFVPDKPIIHHIYVMLSVMPDLLVSMCWIRMSIFCWHLLCLPALPQHTEGFKKRWFTMDDRRLMYFKDPLVRRDLRPRVSFFQCWLIAYFAHSFVRLPLFLPPRMPTPAVRCSSAVRRTATLSCPACPRPRRATTGTTASPSSRQTGSSCLPARPRPSNGIG